jgi:hypothetical protein
VGSSHTGLTMAAIVFRLTPRGRWRRFPRSSPGIAAGRGESPRGIRVPPGARTGEIDSTRGPLAVHESPRTTKLYDRTGDAITFDKVEWITI